MPATPALPRDCRRTNRACATRPSRPRRRALPLTPGTGKTGLGRSSSAAASRRRARRRGCS
eukprot:3687095-Pleurochrysis_carterae.AAC.1